MARDQIVLLAIPLALAISGAAWMSAATQHFEKQSGPAFCGLAGHHYSVPEWGFAYHPGGEHIERWTVLIPSSLTFGSLLLSGVSFSVTSRRRRVWQLVAWSYHIIIGVAFALVAAWYWFNVMGVFI